MPSYKPVQKARAVAHKLAEILSKYSGKVSSTILLDELDSEDFVENGNIAVVSISYEIGLTDGFGSGSMDVRYDFDASGSKKKRNWNNFYVAGPIVDFSDMEDTPVSLDRLKHAVDSTEDAINDANNYLNSIGRKRRDGQIKKWYVMAKAKV